MRKEHNWQFPLAGAILLVLIVSLTGCLQAEQEATAAGTTSQAAVTKQTADKLPATDLQHAALAVSGMTCGSCEQAIQRSVGKLAGVSMVKASFSTGRVDVDYDPQQVDEQAIIGAIERLQYKVGENPPADEDSATADEPQDQAPSEEPAAEPADDTQAEETTAEDAGEAAESEDAAAEEPATEAADKGATGEGCEECSGECEGGEGCASAEETEAAAEAETESGGGCAGCAKEAAGVNAPASVPAGLERVTLKIEQMTCAGKSGWVNNTVGGLEGIGGCYADEGTLTAVIDYDPAKWTVAKLIEVINTESEGFFTPTEV
jgi:copper ion binding protein